MYSRVLKQAALKLLKSLPPYITDRFYLAGGTALALQLGHRYSLDFDFFTETTFENEFLKNTLQHETGKFTIIQEQKGTSEVFCQGLRIAFYHYPYPLLENTIQFENIRLAVPADIIPMKLSAISCRGSRKDFIDLYFLKDKCDLTDLSGFERKFADSEYNLYHVIKSVAYFDDAREEPMPRMIAACDWNEVEKYFKDLQIAMAERYRSQ